MILNAPGGDAGAIESAIERGRIIAEATNFARELINEPANVITPTELARRSEEVAKQYGLEIDVLDDARMKELGMGAFLGVAQGSAEPAKIIVLTYSPKRRIKRNHRHRRQGDHLRHRRDFDQAVGWDGEDEIRYGGRRDNHRRDARHRSAQAICQSHRHYTDDREHAWWARSTARRRRTRDDGQDHRSHQHRRRRPPDPGRRCRLRAQTRRDEDRRSGDADRRSLDRARRRLCRASRQQSGLDRSGIAAARKAGEKIWQLPLDHEYREQIKSEIADIKNVGGRKAGTITAAYFIREFVEETPWAHLDIAGTAWNESAKPYLAVGPTAFACGRW